MMRAQMCGAPTGGVIEIQVTLRDQEKAERLGFSKIEDLR
jgi:hypothetical protein